MESGHLLRYPHISICWEQSDTWALDNVLQELGRERTIAMSLPEFEQSLFMAAQPDNLLLATAPRYCQYYNQLHQLPLVALPLPFDESQQKSWKSLLPFCGINGTAVIRRSSGYGKPLKSLRVDGITESYETRPNFTMKCKKL